MKKSIEWMTAKPLSFIKYFHNNLKRSVAMTIALAVSVTMVIIFQMITYSVLEGPRLGDVGVVSKCTPVYPGESGKIDSAVVEKVEKSTAVERIIPIDSQTTDYFHFFGNAFMRVFFIDDKNVHYVMDKLGLKVIKGRMPQPGSHEILLDWRLANNKSKKLGDYVGKEVDSEERIPGKYKIVGILDGSCIVGIIPTMEQESTGKSSMLVFPKRGGLEEFNSGFKDVPVEKARFWTREKAEENYNENKNVLNTIIGVVAVAIILVMSFAAGNSSYAQYFSRRYEFGVLQSIGFSRAQVLLRAAREVILLNLVGFAVGIVLSVLLGLLFGKLFFEPKGYLFMIMQFDGLLEAMVIPVCTIVFSLIPAGWVLSKIDPMMVVEKFE